jgi:hypothetical protein
MPFGFCLAVYDLDQNALEDRSVENPAERRLGLSVVVGSAGSDRRVMASSRASMTSST